MNVHQVVTANELERGWRYWVAAGAPVAHAVHGEAGFDRLHGGHGAGRKNQPQGCHPHCMAVLLQGFTQPLHHALSAALCGQKLPGQLQDLHTGCTSPRSRGRCAIQSRKRRRRRRGSSHMAKKIA